MKETIRFIYLNAMLLVTIFVASPGLGQEDKNEKPSLLSIALSNMEAQSALRVAGTVLEGELLRLDVDERKNLLIAYGPPSALKKLKELVAQIDVEAGPRNDRQIRVFSLVYAQSNDIAEVLMQLLITNSESDPRIASDSVSNNVVVSGRSQDLDMIESLIARLDEKSDNESKVENQTDNIIVRVTWLVDGAELDSVMNGSLRDPNSTLKDLVAGLAESGSMLDAKVVTNMQTSVQVDSSQRKANEFNNSSMRTIGGVKNGVAKRSNAMMQATGEVRQTANGKYKLAISLDLSQDSDEFLSLGSTVTLPKNHPVAFSISDVGAFKSAIVVEILDVK